MDRHKIKTFNRLTALYLGLPGLAGTWRNIHPRTSMRKNSHRQQGLLWASEGCYAQLSQHKTSWPHGWLKLTANAFDRLWISMPAVLVSTYCYTELNCIRHQLPPLLLVIFWILWCRERTRGRRTNNTSGRHRMWTIGVPPTSSPILTQNALSATTLPIYPGLGQAPDNAGLHTQCLQCFDAVGWAAGRASGL